MSRINFPALFGNILQFNMTHMLNVIAEQELEKEQYHALVSGLVDGKINLSQIEMSQDGVRVTPSPEAAIDLSAFNSEDLARALIAKQEDREDIIQMATPEDPEEIMDNDGVFDKAPFAPPENENFDKAS